MATTLVLKSEIKLNDRKIVAIDVPKGSSSNIVITASLDKKINFFTSDLKNTKNFETGHVITAMKADSTGDNLVYGAYDGRVILLNDEEKVEFKGSIKCIHTIDICSKSNRILTGDNNGRINLFNVNGSIIKSFELGEPVLSIKFIPSSPFFACGMFDGTVRIIDIETEQTITSFFEGEQIDLEKHDGAKTFPASVIDISPDGSIVAYGNKHGQIFINTIETKKLFYSCDLKEPVSDISFAPINPYIAIGASKTLFVFDVMESQIIIKENMENEIASVNWCGSDIIVGFLNGEIRNYNLN